MEIQRTVGMLRSPQIRHEAYAHGVLKPYGFDGAVWRVDEHRTNSGVASAEFDVRGTHGRLIARLLDGIGHRMMAQIAGRIMTPAARTSSNRESPEPGNTATVPDRRVKVAAHLHAKFGVWQRVGHTTAKSRNAIGSCNRPTRPDPTGCSAFEIFDGYQRTLFDQAERVGGGHADSSVGGIGIGVPNPQRATGEVELPDDLTTIPHPGDRMHGTEEQRMVADRAGRMPPAIAWSITAMDGSAANAMLRTSWRRSPR